MASFRRFFVVCFGSAFALAAPLSASASSSQPAVHMMAPASSSTAQSEYFGELEPMGSVLFGCQKTVPATCFGPAQLRAAYGIQPLLDRNVTGAGRTIVIVDGFQSPTIEPDLARFDALWGLSAPPSFRQFAPDGLTPFNGHDPEQFSWSLEISIDVEMAHAMAPGAAIVLVLARSGSDVDLLRATRYAVEHNLGDVITQAFGEAELCAARGVIGKQHAVFAEAAERGITVVAASGDQGATQHNCDAPGFLSKRAVSTPASDPLVTSVGGTTLVADGSTGLYGSETAWNDLHGASGGGFSTAFHSPGFQAPFDIHGREGRGVPDVAYNAGSASIIGYSAVPIPGPPGLAKIGGSSAGAAQWAGIVALADQSAGRRLGPINQALYHVAKGHAGGTAFHDITTGNNSFNGVAGFDAAPGWDAVTGLGSPNAAVLVPALAAGEEDD